MQNRIIMFVSSFPINTAGGIERVIANYANYFSGKGYDIIISYRGKSNNKSFFYLNSKISIILLSENKLLAWYNYIAIIRKYKPNIIISLDAITNKYASIANYIKKDIIVIGTEHIYAGLPRLVKARFSSGKYKLLAEYLHNKLDALVVLTKVSASYLIENTKIKKTVIIPNPLIYPLPINKPVILPENFIKININTLIAVGRLSKEKGFHLLISVFSKLIIKHNWILVILGEGEQRIELEQQIAILNLQNKVLLPGVVGNLSDWYKSADLFVFTSLYEGFGCALVEAMAHGLPVVSFDCKAGPSEIIQHEVNGLLVEDGNTKELLKSLERLMVDTKLRKNFSKKALEVRERFNIIKIGAMWEDLFVSLEKNKICS